MRRALGYMSQFSCIVQIYWSTSCSRPDSMIRVDNGRASRCRGYLPLRTAGPFLLIRNCNITETGPGPVNQSSIINHQPQLGNGPPAAANTAFLPALNLAATPDQVQQHVGLGAHVSG